MHTVTHMLTHRHRHRQTHRNKIKPSPLWVCLHVTVHVCTHVQMWMGMCGWGCRWSKRAMCMRKPEVGIGATLHWFLPLHWDKVSQFSTELADSASSDSQRDPFSASPAHPPGTMWVLGTQTSVLTLGQKILYTLRHSSSLYFLYPSLVFSGILLLLYLRKSDRGNVTRHSELMFHPIGFSLWFSHEQVIPGILMKLVVRSYEDYWEEIF